MPQRPFVRFLLSLDAIQVHLLCLCVIVVVSISLWEGKPQPDYAWALLFAIVAWPVLLGLRGGRYSRSARSKYPTCNRSHRPGDFAQRPGGGEARCLHGRRCRLARVFRQSGLQSISPAHLLGYFLVVVAIAGDGGGLTAGMGGRSILS